MRRSFYPLTGSALFCFLFITIGTASAQPTNIPEVLQPWKDWVTWHDKHLNCPMPYNNAETHLCFWPSRLSLSADQNSGSWTTEVNVFSETWIPLPGSDAIWPLNVQVDGTAIAVIKHNGRPSVKLQPGSHRLSGAFFWDQMPQRIAIPQQIGLLSLAVEGNAVVIPNWDNQGNVWLRRLRSEVADKDLLSVQVYRVIEDGIPMWLRTEIELTVSGKSREEDFGWVLPEGWHLSKVDSPLPVAVDDQGRMKAQVRAGKWTVRADAFRAADVKDFQFAAGALPITNLELIGFQSKPEFRLVEFEAIQAIDVNQTTFPSRWRNLPVYQWNTGSAFQLIEKMRGIGLSRPEGLSIHRQFWLDENGNGLTYRDRIEGQMQQIWRLNVAQGQNLGAVRIDGKGQLITADPQDGAPGVELRTRNLNLEAIGRMDRTTDLSAVGWQTDVDSLDVTFTLPPGWRVLALFGADHVDGDWLTAWSLLDLFLLLIFSLAVFRVWGVKAGLVAFFAFGLSYHEFGSPRLTWLFLLMPLALLRVVPEGIARKWIMLWKYIAVVLLVICLIPFVARQIQSAIYPQLERPGINYRSRSFFSTPSASYKTTTGVAKREMAQLERAFENRDFFAGEDVAAANEGQSSRFAATNLMYAPQAKIQTGPAEPKWNWNQVHCSWNSPVSAEQQIKPILISLPIHRILTVVRLVLLLLLVSILLSVKYLRKPITKKPISKKATAAAMLLGLLLLPSQASAQVIPDPQMLNILRERLLETSDAYPNAAEIASVQMALDDNRITMVSEIHTAIEVAVPLPGRLPAWSPVSVKLDDQTDAIVSRKDGYLWVIVPKGVHQVKVEGLLPETSEWEWTYLLKPRRISVNAPGWDVIGIQPNGVAEQQVFFRRIQQAAAGEAAYDRKDFQSIVSVNRHLEVGLIWQMRTEVTRLSQTGKAISLNVPLLAGESVLSTNVVAENNIVEVRLGANQKSFSWNSELPIGEAISLQAADTDQWIERWHLVTSPVWNVSSDGLSPIFESQQQNLIPVWQPWPDESVNLSFRKPDAVSGEIITVRSVRHETSLGSRRRTTNLQLELETSLGTDFNLELNPQAEISSLNVNGQMIPPVQREGKLIVPLNPGTQSVEIAWDTSVPLNTIVVGEQVILPIEGSNISTVMNVPSSRWVLWANGPLRGPAVRFWVILICAVLAALILGSLSLSPLRRTEWILLTIGLTQIHISAAMIVVSWLFLLAWRGKQDSEKMSWFRFNLLQLVLVMLTFIVLGIFVLVVGEGLLGNPEMFIVGNGSSPTYLKWFQPRLGTVLPEPQIVSISVWFYRLLMLFWALWLANALLRWLRRGWGQFTHTGGWKHYVRKSKIPPSAPEAT